MALTQDLKRIDFGLGTYLGLMEERRKKGVRMPIDQSMMEWFIGTNKYIKDAIQLLKRLLSLPYSSIEKAIQFLDTNINDEEKIKVNAEVKRFTKHVLSIRQWINFLQSEELRYIATSRFFASRLNELADTLEDLIAQGERLQALQMAEFHHHVFERIQLRSGGVKAIFIFFNEDILFGDELDKVFKTAEYTSLLLAHKNSTFHEMYLDISNWFFNHVIMHTLQKEADFFESFYGPRNGWNLNFIIYFTIKRGTQPLMFVREDLKFEVRNPRTGQMVKTLKSLHIHGTPETRVFRIYVSLQNFVKVRDKFPRSFFHEITHIFHPSKTVWQFMHYFPKMRVEGLATLTEIAGSPSNITMRYLNKSLGYLLLASEAKKKEILQKNDSYVQYVLGLHMWLVIYFSKLNLRANPDLTAIREDLAQYMQGNYKKIFYAWFMRFRQFTNGQFLELYLEGARKLGLGIILDQETITFLRGSKFYYIR